MAMGSAYWLVEELDCRLELWSDWVLATQLVWEWARSLEPLLDTEWEEE